jgi:hypothetical protein
MSSAHIRQTWCKNMEKVDSEFYNCIKNNSASYFEGIRMVAIQDLIEDLQFSDPTIDPRDILCFVEKCVDERFIYNRTLPTKALENPKVKFNYRQAIVDFGIPGVGCLYSDKESQIMANKIANYLQKNSIPVYVSEAHEGCGAVQAKIKQSNLATDDNLFVTAMAKNNAKSAADKVLSAAKELNYPIEVFTKFATMEECFRIKSDDSQEEIASIHNGSGIIFLPNFFEKKPFAKVFLPDKFCLSNGLCMFNMLDSGKDLDAGLEEKLNPNSTAEYIVFCIKIMLGEHGLGVEFFQNTTPLLVVAACDKNETADTLRAYQVITQVKKLIQDDSKLKELKGVFDFTILEY